MIVKLFLANVFADGLFSGEKVAVAVLRHLGQESFLQALASELALPVTAYVLPNQDGFVIRYFTPEKELESADYAALAAARVLLNIGLTPAGKPVNLQGRGGTIIVRPDRDDLALTLKRPAPAAGRPELTAAGEPPESLGLTAADIVGRLASDSWALICCRDQAALRSIASSKAAAAVRPGRRLTFSAPLEISGLSGYIVRDFTAAGEESGPPFDLAPHALLAPFWAERLGAEALTVHRLSARNLLMRVEMRDENFINVSGQVNLIFKADPLMDELTGNLPPDLFF